MAVPDRSCLEDVPVPFGTWKSRSELLRPWCGEGYFGVEGLRSHMLGLGGVARPIQWMWMWIALGLFMKREGMKEEVGVILLKKNKWQ